MSTTDKNANGHIPQETKYSGLGQVKVDGKTVYDTGESIERGLSEVFDGVGASAKQASDAANTTDIPTSHASGSYTQAGDTNQCAYHYPDSNAAKSAATGNNESWMSSVNKWGVWVGVILVSLGTLIFLDLLSGFVPALENIFGGYSFWRFWPLFIIFGGIAMAFSPSSDSPDPRRRGSLSLLRFTEGMFTMTVGVVLLGNSLRYVSWLNWPAMLSFWPLLLVIIGLAILSHALKTEWFSILGNIISVVVLLSVAASMWIGVAPLSEPFATLAQFGAYRGMDIFNIGSMVEIPWYNVR